MFGDGIDISDIENRSDCSQCCSISVSCCWLMLQLGFYSLHHSIKSNAEANVVGGISNEGEKRVLSIGLSKG
jgi:hypothetical protein